MKKEQNDIHEIVVTGYGYELIRNTLLPDILGKEYHSLLYWAGKSLARKMPLETIEQLIEFFIKASWGNLVIKEEKKDTIVFELSSDLITNRFIRKDESSYQLEAGFLAAQIQHQKGYITEASEEQKKKENKIMFVVKWDTYDPE